MRPSKNIRKILKRIADKFKTNDLKTAIKYEFQPLQNEIKF